MFNNIIYFIVVLLIFNISYPDTASKDSFFFFLLQLFLSWLLFAVYCDRIFRNLKRRLDNRDGSGQNDGRLTARYQKLTVRLSVLAIFLFALAVYFFNLKYWIQMIPGFDRFSVLQGIFALALFLFYLTTIWHIAYPAYNRIFRPGITLRAFIVSNLRLNLPILFPWFSLSLVYDLMGLSPWAGPGSFIHSVEGQIVFFAAFLMLLMIFMPRIIQYWWGCKPFGNSEKAAKLRTFLNDKGFKYRGLLSWPIFEGRMMTAGIMGIIPRYRYILVTDSLMDVLSVGELKGVVAHEMGHAKYRHLPFYLLFFLGFMIVSFGSTDIFFYLIYSHPFFIKIISQNDPQTMNFFYLFLAFPMLITLLVYFRYVMGFFMRNFERQADLYAAVTIGSPEPLISSLEKIAYLAGNSRNLPSWHHFSIKERVACLWRNHNDPTLVKRHNRFVLTAFLVYLGCMGCLGYFLNFGPVKHHLTYSLAEKIISQELLKEPDNMRLYQNLAIVYQEMGKEKEAIQTYEKILAHDPDQAVTLNNLAWLLVTAADKELRDEIRGLQLAKKAVSLKRNPVFLDTMAEAYYANGAMQEAIKTIKEALAMAVGKKEYYKKQLRKFLSSATP
jgi:Zn-dependent protease with chaperone function